VYEYQSDKRLYEKYRDGGKPFEIKRHTVKDYYAHFHFAVEICSVRRGSFEFILNGARGRASEGEILFVNSGEIHQYFESDGCEVVICIMNDTYTADFTAEFGNVRFDSLLTDGQANAEAARLMDEEFGRQNDDFFLDKKVFADRLYGILCRAYPVRPPRKEQLLLSEVLEYVHSHFKENLTVGFVAEQFSYSRSRFLKLFQRNVGVDFRVFLNDMRAGTVHHALRDPQYVGWTLIQVVQECGFQSMATFYRSYKRLYGRLPERNALKRKM
jgi:AraC-like DNA-binding protein